MAKHNTQVARTYASGIGLVLFLAGAVAFLGDGAWNISAKAAESIAADGQSYGYLACREWLAEASGMVDCFSGPGETPAPPGPWTSESCLEAFDAGGDGDVDLRDFAALLTAPAVELGDSFNQPYECLLDDDVMPVQTGFQGGIHFYMSLRLSGFRPNTQVKLFRDGVFLDNGEMAVYPYTVPQVLFTDIGGGVNEHDDLFVGIFVAPGTADGRTARLTFTVTDLNDPDVTATVVRSVLFVE